MMPMAPTAKRPVPPPGRRYTRRGEGEDAPRTGDSDQSALAMARWFGGTSSSAEMKDAIVPGGRTPDSLAALVLAPSGARPSVFEARCTHTSAGTESTPQEGTITACVFVAR